MHSWWDMSVDEMVIRHRYTIGGALRGTARHQIRLELKEYGRRTDGHEGNVTPVRKRPFIGVLYFRPSVLSVVVVS